jgi:hypothetical protein
MSKHTPGPWKIEDLIEIEDLIDGEFPYSIETPYVTVAWVTGIGEEAQANAQLIAASPTMYNALKTIIALPDNFACPSVKNFAKEAIKEIE